jgi:predicted dehydrogenase
MIKKVRWGLAGCGDIANKRVAPAIRSSPDGELSACARKNSALLHEFQKRHEIPKGYRTYAELLDDPDIDAIYLATPVYLHCSQTIEAAQKGKHVLCEKPMAMDSEQCLQMIRVCRKLGVKLGVAYYRRFYPVVRKIKQLLENRLIGDPILARTTLVEHTSTGNLAEATWRFVPELGGGGLLMDMASHRLDLLAMLFGSPASVSAVTDTRVLEIPVEDTGSLLIRFANGLHAMAFASHCSRFPMDDIEIYGTEGCVKAGPLNGAQLVVTTDRSETLHLPKADNVHLPLIEDFNEAVRSDRDPCVNGEEGVKASLILEAAYRSARTGEVVKFEKDWPKSL